MNESFPEKFSVSPWNFHPAQSQGKLFLDALKVWLFRGRKSSLNNELPGRSTALCGQTLIFKIPIAFKSFQTKHKKSATQSLTMKISCSLRSTLVCVCAGTQRRRRFSSQTSISALKFFLPTRKKKKKFNFSRWWQTAMTLHHLQNAKLIFNFAALLCCLPTER